jgi:hypothetical protein
MFEVENTLPRLRLEELSDVSLLLSDWQWSWMLQLNLGGCGLSVGLERSKPLEGSKDVANKCTARVSL